MEIIKTQNIFKNVKSYFY